MVKTMSLMDCGESETILLPRDNFEVKDFSLLTDGFNVWLGEQRMGEYPAQKIKIPKTVFDSLIRKYVGPQIVKEKANPQRSGGD